MRQELLSRQKHRKRVEKLLAQFPVVAIVGPRQVGKTTLARLVTREREIPVHHFDLEDPAD